MGTHPIFESDFDCLTETIMSGHGHSHSCGGGCDHDENFEIATDFLLHTKITPTGFECLGEEEDGTGIKVFKHYEERTQVEDFVISDCDPELLFNIPFDGNVKLKSMIVIGEEGEFQPVKVKMFKNKVSMTFDDVTKDADQEISLAPDPRGEVQYPLKGEFTKVSREAVIITNYEIAANPAD